MASKQLKALKNLSADELVRKVRETENELFHSRMKQVTGQLEKTHQTWVARKQLARMKGLLSAQGKKA